MLLEFAGRTLHDVFFPTVTETRLALEPCTADTFIADLDARRSTPRDGAAAVAGANGTGQ